MGVDGTIFEVPDSEANASVFARPSAGPRGEGAFPQVRKLSLVELGTHVELGLVVRSSAHGDQSMIGGLFRHLTPEMLLFWDRGFFSYELWREMTAHEGLLWEMQGERTEPRRNRINPRMIKRKMSKWKKKRPEHRRIPPLRKTFSETVVMSR
ncbi:hypothetical protein V5E97_39045 [Singulisphaera sp. Ch08]|uniref:Transposase n=1 Tax=Singulisphaera sp. Ch08 TaxID=3120278 RepID=A0AAU7CFW6_9BACT